MNILSACLLTFIITIFILSYRISEEYEMISKEQIKSSKYLSFKDGTLYKKCESEDNKQWKNPTNANNT